MEPEPLPTNDAANFARFINQADLTDIKHFLKAAGSSQEAFNLTTLWVHAFAERRKVKQAEEYTDGYEAGYQDCERQYKGSQEH
jgi:hypothetical protein